LIPIASTLLDLEMATSWLRQRLSSERFQHSLGAQEKAVELAEKFRLPQEERERASVAALLHDAAKLMSPAELLSYCEQHHLPISEMDRLTPQTLHPFVGAELVRATFNLHDEDVLNAIRYHTTARVGMSRVEKLVYIADKIEGNTRNPLYSQKMTAFLDYQDPLSLDLTMLYILDSTIQFLMSKHQVIHPRTVDARNDFVVRLRAEKRL
jgi:predicted HD superfamily hydrolase involved in NAD metabolism